MKSEAKQRVKDSLSPCKTRSLAVRKTVFNNLKDRLLLCEWIFYNMQYTSFVQSNNVVLMYHTGIQAFTKS